MNNIRSVAKAFCSGNYDNELPASIWPPVFNYIVENHTALELQRDKVHMLWTVSGGHLRDKIRDDDLIASVLRLTMPGYAGEGLILYRGECRFLFDAGQVGFCWTPDRTVAEMFARGLNAIESGGVLLSAYAPTAAILTAPNSHSAGHMREFEYTCDPDLLENIEVIGSYAKSAD